MCGIVGYVGSDRKAKEVVLSGLRRLEYRGYDSAGITLYDPRFRVFDTYKDIGRVAHLTDISKKAAPSPIGMGHTRWATHGAVTKGNAHPHASQSGRFIAVHNGVIENSDELKRQYLSDVYFSSETDTEVIVQLIEKMSVQMNIENAISTTLKLLEGSYALLVIDTENPETIYAGKNKSPLVLGQNEEGYIVASDIMALSDYCDSFVALQDETFTVIHDDRVHFFDLNHQLIEPDYLTIDDGFYQAEKGEFDHFMLKEIYEQPSVIRRLMTEYLLNENDPIDDTIVKQMLSADRIYIIAAGTSMHAGFIGKRLFEKYANKPTDVHIASEFAYGEPYISDKPFYVFISQSGETADLRACLIKIRKTNAKVLTITNVKTSTLAREADFALDLFAGPEIAVASTKAYVAQVALLSILADKLGAKLDIHDSLNRVALAIDKLLSEQSLRLLVHDKLKMRNCFYIGRGIDYYTSLEAALKLKEISYIQTEGFAAGELKHGTIALIEQDTPVIALISDRALGNHTRSNLKEVIARGANPIVISTRSASNSTDDVIVEDVHPALSSMIMVVPTQLIAYYAALDRQLDIDKPRNLAKSVTVE